MATDHDGPHCGGAFRIEERVHEPEYLCPLCGGRVFVGAPAPALPLPRPASTRESSAAS